MALGQRRQWKTSQNADPEKGLPHDDPPRNRDELSAAFVGEDTNQGFLYPPRGGQNGPSYRGKGTRRGLMHQGGLVLVTVQRAVSDPTKPTGTMP